MAENNAKPSASRAPAKPKRRRLLSDDRETPRLHEAITFFAGFAGASFAAERAAKDLRRHTAGEPPRNPC